MGGLSVAAGHWRGLLSHIAETCQLLNQQTRLSALDRRQHDRNAFIELKDELAPQWTLTRTTTRMSVPTPASICRHRWYELAKRSTGKQRLDYLACHTMAVWLWTLAQRKGTPCMPLIVQWQCTTHRRCGGIGDRIKGIQVGFWLVRYVREHR